MPYLVISRLVTEARVRASEARLSHDPHWRGIADETEGARRLRTAAQFAAIDIALIEQLSASDPRPVDPVAV